MCIRFSSISRCSPLLLSLLGAFATAPAFCQTPDLGVGASLHGKPLFPTNNPWNQDISTLPVDSNSAVLLATIGPTARLHPDFGSGKNWMGIPFGIPYVVVPGTQALVPIRSTYASESDPGPYPIPKNAPIEGGSASDGDRHVIVIDRDHWKLYETYYSFPQNNGGWQVDSGAVFNLASNALRPVFWTSADAAGLPIFPGLVRYDEVVEQKAINHALRFTVAHTRRAFVAPARHLASSLLEPKYPPMGMRVRLKATYDISKFPAEAKIILTALKKYGMIVADNGSNWYISGAPDARWDDNQLDTLKTVPGSAFEVVKMGEIITDKVSAPSGVRASAGVDKVSLTWNPNSAATSGFLVKRGLKHCGPYSVIARGVATANYVDVVPGGVTYYYVIDGVNPTGQSIDSLEVSALPRKVALPTGLTNLMATAFSRTQVDLTWTNANTATTAVLVRVERSTDGINFTTVSTPNGTTKSTSVFNLLPNTVYCFRVRAENLDGVTLWSNIASVKTKTP